MARLKSAFTTFWTTWSGWMDELGTHGKVGLVTFALAFFVLFIFHLVYLPHYWSNVSPQRQPVDLYLPSVWMPAIIYFAVLMAAFAVVTSSLLSWLRSGKAYFVGPAIFLTTLFLVALGFYVFFGVGVLLRGRPMHLDAYLWGKSGRAVEIVTGLVALISAVATTAGYGCYKLVRWARKRLKANATS
ncbi:MAG: hypothetical protein NWE82_02790 [Candidatus Bathyarchaeota archaeon]|nr:hypothetical protein [Candidatus Bathyarchaeota archaeon]